jgi:hypothetical protein
MALPENELPTQPDFLVMFKMERGPTNTPQKRRSAYLSRIEVIHRNLEEVNRCLEEKGLMDQVRFGVSSPFGIVPTYCKEDLAELLKNAPNIYDVIPSNIKLQIKD